MPNNPNKLSQFWQELKRRKVIYMITVYASAAFVIIELVNNVSEPLSLPERIPSIVIIILAIGFPIAVLLSWIFDLTPKGMERTKPLSELQDAERPVIQNKWKIATYVSIAVIVGLIILNLFGGPTKLKAGDIQSILILPFENLTGDEQLNDMITGMHALLVGDVGRIDGVWVLGTTTSNAYKDANISAMEIASELGVDAIIETSVFCLGDTVCMQPRLVRTTGKEEQIWVADYMEDKSQMINLNNKLTKLIADEIMIELTPEKERILAQSRTVDREAYDAFLKSQIYKSDVTEESLNKAMEYLNRGVEKEPDWAPLYFSLAEVWRGGQQMGYIPMEIAQPKIFENYKKALELDPNSADAFSTTASIALWVEWNWNKAEEDFLKAIALNPNNALTRMYYAHLLYYLQRRDEASKQAQLAFDLDPLNPFIQSAYSLALLFAGDCEAAMEVLEEILALEPEHALVNSIMEKAAFHCGDYDKVIEVAKYHMPIKDDAFFIQIEKIYAEQGFIAAYEAILHQLEISMLNEFIINPGTLACKYHMVQQYDKAMDWIEIGYEKRDQNMLVIATEYYKLIHLYDNPRFIEIVQKMNLPLPED